MKQLKTTRGIQVMGALGLGLVMLAGPAAARERIRQDLTAVADPDAKGQVRVLLKTASSGEFEVRVGGLDADTTYEVLVAGVKVGTLTTSGGGGGRARFRTRPRGRHDQLLGFDPRGAAVVLRSPTGEDVLGGTIPAGSVGGSTDKIACCIPDDSECEDRTAEECTAQGGTVSTALSCLPDPCASTPSVGGDVVCCIPDDSGAECEDRTTTECAAQGGVVVQAASCDPNPCAATPPTNPDIRCCLPDDSGVECEDRTPDQCDAQGGVNLGPGACTPNPCAGAGASSQPSGGDDHGGGNHGSGSRGGGTNGGTPTSTTGDNHGGRTTYY
jgi:hypothetical protein